jgi:hypothetical protein
MTYAATGWISRALGLGGKCQSQKVPYCVIPFRNILKMTQEMENRFTVARG